MVHEESRLDRHAGTKADQEVRNRSGKSTPRGLWDTEESVGGGGGAVSVFDGVVAVVVGGQAGLGIVYYLQQGG